MNTPLKSKDHRRRLALSSAYRSKVLSTAPNSLIQYLPLWDPVGETALVDQSLEGNDAVADTVTFGVEGIGDGHKAGSFDGSNSFVNAHSTALNADFDGEEYTFFGWARVASSSVWSDSSERNIARFTVDGSNVIIIRKTATNDNLQGLMIAGGTNDNVNSTALAGTTDWFSWALTSSLAADELKFYLNGDQVGATQTGLGTFVGNLLSTGTVFGASNTTPLVVWSGNLAHNAVWNTPITANQIKNLSIIN